MGWSLVIAASCFLAGWWARGRLGSARDLPLRAHRAAFRLWWRWRSRRRGGRPRISRELIDLIHRISAENPLWGAPRIHGELLKLGFRLAQSTVSKYMAPRAGRPGQSWTTFLSNHAGAIAAIDLFTVRTLTFECLYAFLVLGHDRRTLLHIEVARHAGALWLAGQIAAAFAQAPTPLFLVRDNDRAFGAAFREQVRALGIDDRPTRPRSPWQNGHVERLIGSIRRECLDHIIILSAAHLRRVLSEYAQYYNADRTHLALAKDTPCGRPVEVHGSIASWAVLGGLHRRYRRNL